MSDIAPEPRADLARTDILEPSRRQRWRTQRLFDLAVTASGCEPRRIARAIGLDIRSLGEMRDLPSLHAIARIASALGIETASAAEVVGRCGEAAGGRDSVDDALCAEILRADLDDDANALERLADETARFAREPGDLALAILCAARADAARGEVTLARQRARAAENIGFPAAPRSVAAALVSSIHAEAMLGEAWRPLDAVRASDGTAAVDTPQRRLRHPRSMDARGFRAVAAGLAADLVQTSDLGCVRERLAALHGHVVDALEHGCDRAVAWTASVAGIAALRLRESATLDARSEQAAMSLFVCAQFAIDGRIAGDDTSRSMSLLRRRLRLALHEWCDRARRGELHGALLDEVDDREVKAMYVRFPRARPA